ncbi:MAG: putative rane protein [Clostridiales bacterium]|nr:putative rane protein [Clostridiales bacterium]
MTQLVIQLTKRTFQIGMVQGLGLAVVITMLARNLSSLPFLSIMGTMVIAILLGIGWRAVMGIPSQASEGINFAAKRLLKLGVILMGVRLNIGEVIAAGPKIIFLDAVLITFTIFFFWWLGAKMGLTKKLTALIGVGTAVCGAAAIAVVAPIVNSKDDETALSVAIIALMGTIGAVLFTLLQPILGLSDYAYGVWVGSTLHEVAHVVAASMAGGAISGDIGILVKLGRVALLIPVAFIMGTLFKENKAVESKMQNIAIPWFVLGFLGLSALQSLGIIPDTVSKLTLQASIFILTIAMAALGLNVEISMFKKLGAKSITVGIIGSTALVLVGRLLLILLGVN